MFLRNCCNKSSFPPGPYLTGDTPSGLKEIPANGMANLRPLLNRHQIFHIHESMVKKTFHHIKQIFTTGLSTQSSTTFAYFFLAALSSIFSINLLHFLFQKMFIFMR